jgi:hypothetical protein
MIRKIKDAVMLVEHSVSVSLELSKLLWSFANYKKAKMYVAWATNTDIRQDLSLSHIERIQKFYKGSLP